MIYKSHQGPVRCLHWFDDDSGFISGGWDGNVFAWHLYVNKNDVKDGKDCNPKFAFTHKNFQFACVANKPESKDIVYAADVDKSVKQIHNGKETDRYEAGVNISQIQVLNGGKAMVCGIAENDRPGSIQVVKLPFERALEV